MDEIEEGCTPADARVLIKVGCALAEENDRLRHAILTLLGETDDSDYMTGLERRAFAKAALVPNAKLTRLAYGQSGGAKRNES